MSTMLDKIGLDVDIINIRFKYSDADTISDIEYSNSNTDVSEPLKTNSISNTVRKYPVSEARGHLGLSAAGLHVCVSTQRTKTAAHEQNEQATKEIYQKPNQNKRIRFQTSTR